MWLLPHKHGGHLVIFIHMIFIRVQIFRLFFFALVWGWLGWFGWLRSSLLCSGSFYFSLCWFSGLTGRSSSTLLASFNSIILVVIEVDLILRMMNLHLPLPRLLIQACFPPNHFRSNSFLIWFYTRTRWSATRWIVLALMWLFGLHLLQQVIFF